MTDQREKVLRAAYCSRALARRPAVEAKNLERGARSLFCNAPTSPERSSGQVWREATSGVRGGALSARPQTRFVGNDRKTQSLISAKRTYRRRADNCKIYKM